MASKSLVNIVLLNKASKGLTAMKSAGILAAQNGISGLGFELFNDAGMGFAFFVINKHILKIILQLGHRAEVLANYCIVREKRVIFCPCERAFLCSCF